MTTRAKPPRSLFMQTVAIYAAQAGVPVADVLSRRRFVTLVWVRKKTAQHLRTLGYSHGGISMLLGIHRTTGMHLTQPVSDIPPPFSVAHRRWLERRRPQVWAAPHYLQSFREADE